MDFLDDFEVLRPAMAGLALSDVVAGRADPNAVALLGLVLDRIRACRRLPLDIYTLEDVIDDTERLWGVSSRELITWGRRHFEADRHLPYLLALFALVLFPTEDGIWIGTGEVERRCGRLPYDDGLLDVRAAQAEPKRAGVFIGPHYLRYHPWLERFNLGLSGGFFEWLLALTELPSLATGFLELRVDPDIVMDRKHCHEIVTREYLRGPKGLSVEQLNDPRFPERPDGTVTEHHRLDPDGDLSLLGMDLLKLQAMWSHRDGIKSVQIEELVPLEAKELDGYPYVANRYVHAQWHTADGCFRHFDGAVKLYKKQRYPSRYGTDLRNHDAGTEADDYIKLFRLDGRIRLEFRANLVARFYRHNELVIEYLGGEAEDRENLRSLVAGELRAKYHRR